MTETVSGLSLAGTINEKFPGAVLHSDSGSVVIQSQSWLKVAEFLKTAPEMSFDYLSDLTAIDYGDYFEVVYHLTSIDHNQALEVKVRCHDRTNPEAPSVISLWKSADFMEREVFDMLGIRFSGHPNLKRILLWEGFPGYPLRRDYL